MSKRVLLLGAYGRKNVGDDIFLQIMLNRLKKHSVVFNCWDVENLPPEIELKSKHTPLSSRTSGIPRILMAIFKSDVIVYGGGELWMRLDGTKTPNLSLYKMLVINLLSKMLRKKVYYVSVGSENLRGWSRFIASMTARLATKAYLRDSDSQKILGIKKYAVAPDLAYLYPVKSTPRKSKRNKRIAVSVTRINMADDQKSMDNIIALSKILNTYFSDSEITIISAMSDEKAHESDLYVASLLQEHLKGKSTIYKYNSVDDLVSTLQNQSLVISYRLHVNILAHLADTNVVGVGYKPKVRKYFYSYSTPEAFTRPTELQDRLKASADFLETNPRAQKLKTREIIKGATKAYSKIFEEISANYG